MGEQAVESDGYAKTCGEVENGKKYEINRAEPAAPESEHRGDHAERRKKNHEDAQKLPKP